jgi:hypothetical protein
MKKLLVGALLAVAVMAAGSPARAVDQEDINRAVEHGIEALRRGQAPEFGPWQRSSIGPTALVGLTLLECGVPADDKDVQRAAQAVRKEAVSTTYTYAISSSILFLDRLGDPDDIPLIESLTVRLLAGQDSMGGWTYNCPAISDSERRRLQATVDQRKELVGRRELPKPGTKRTVKDLPEEIRQQIADAERAVVANPQYAWGASDNSNTQFAALALWVGRRQGLPVERALDRLGRRFRVSQNEDGGWPYRIIQRPPNVPVNAMPMGFRSTASMTCAGLICLAVSDASILEVGRERKPDAKPRDLSKDPVLTRGLQALGAVIENPKNIRLAPGWGPRGGFNPKDGPPGGRGGPPAPPPGFKTPPGGARGGPPDPEGFMNQFQVSGRTYYFLWSLERVGVAFGLKTIGNKDWYGWGAEMLLANQQADGSWVGDADALGTDTCFALLFLKRANLAGDLTTELKGMIKDPGERVIRAGGIGGDSLRGTQGGRIESGIERKNNKPAQDPKLADSDSGRLARELLKATGKRQRVLLEQMSNEKGVKYTEALATAIPRMEGDAKRQAREALAERLARMKVETLATYLQDEEAEIRRAAAIACAKKESKILVPNLISLIRDPETSVVLAARAALKDLTRQDFGPSADANRQDRDQAALKWLNWWTKQNREK